MKTLRILILPMVVALCGIHCIDGMEPGRGERSRVVESEETQDEMIYLRSSDWKFIPVRKGIARRLSIYLNDGCDFSPDKWLFFEKTPGAVLSELVMLMTEEYTMLQRGLSIKEIISTQRANLTKRLSENSLSCSVLMLMQAANYFGCSVVKYVLGAAKQESLYDYFASGVLPLRLIDMTPETLNLSNLYEKTVLKPGTLKRIVINALKDQELCCFYHKLPCDVFKQKIGTIVLKAAIQHAGDFAAMPVRLAATSCLLGLTFKSQILQALEIDEQWFDTHVLPAINNKKLDASLHPGGMNPQQLSFVIECARLLQVTSFDISYNSLAALPVEIGLLQRLTQLDVSFNLLTTLPAEIGQLRALTILNAFDNRLTALPVTMGNLRGLKVFNVFHNGLTALPAELVHLQSLEILNAFHNQLTGLPAGIGLLRALVYFDASDNRLRALPGELGQYNRNKLLVAIGKNTYSRSIGQDIVTFPGHPERSE